MTHLELATFPWPISTCLIIRHRKLAFRPLLASCDYHPSEGWEQFNAYSMSTVCWLYLSFSISQSYGSGSRLLGSSKHDQKTYHEIFTVTCNRTLCKNNFCDNADASLPITASGNTNHGLLQGFWQKHRTTDITQPLATVQITDLNMIPGNSTGYGHQCGLLWQHRLKTSTWPLTKSQLLKTFVLLLQTYRKHGPLWMIHIQIPTA